MATASDPWLICSVCRTNVAQSGASVDGAFYCPDHIPQSAQVGGERREQLGQELGRDLPSDTLEGGAGDVFDALRRGHHLEDERATVGEPVPDQAGVLDGEPASGHGTILAAHRWPSNAHLIADVARLGYLTTTDRILDPTWGLGTWWKLWQPDVLVGHDLDPAKAPDGRSIDFTHTGYHPRSFDVVAFDPPYKLNGTSTEEVDARYGVHGDYKGWQAKHRLITVGLDHLVPLLRPRGRLLLKCQDQVCGGAIRWQTDEFTRHCEQLGLEKVDQFQMLGGRPQPKGRRQEHAQMRPSTLLVFRHRRGAAPDQGVLDV
jgi:hypothetical protein